MSESSEDTARLEWLDSAMTTSAREDLEALRGVIQRAYNATDANNLRMVALLDDMDRLLSAYRVASVGGTLSDASALSARERLP
jgi:hypothetical protein